MKSRSQRNLRPPPILAPARTLTYWYQLPGRAIQSQDLAHLSWLNAGRGAAAREERQDVGPTARVWTLPERADPPRLRNNAAEPQEELAVLQILGCQHSEDQPAVHNGQAALPDPAKPAPTDTN